jgi:hypothetical protein
MSSHPRGGVRPRKLLIATFAVGLLLPILAGSAAANWNQPAPGSLNVTPTGNPSGFDMTSIDDVPHVVISEQNTSKLYVKELTSAGWTQVGGDVTTGNWAANPRIVGFGGAPYVTYQQSNGTVNQVFVKRLDGSSWGYVPGPGATPLNNNVSADALTPTIANVGGVLFVAWKEGSPLQVRVKKFDGNNWVSVGGALNADPAKGAGAAPPFIADIGGVPYVGWTEYGSGVEPPGQLFVKRFDGVNWVLVGTSGTTPLNLDSTHDAYGASLADIGGVPYLQWHEGNAPGWSAPHQVHVARFNGSVWTPVGGSANTDTTKNAIGAIHAVGGRPYLTLVQYSATGVGLLRLLRFDGSAWVPVGSPLNLDPTKDADGLRLADVGGVPYDAVYESDAAGRQVYVKRLEPDILSEAATTTSDSAALSAQIDDFGVPLPIGFEWGPTSTFGTREPLQTSPGTGTSTMTRAIGGLTPATTYSFRAFGSDTFRQTALGPTQSFTTGAGPGGGEPPPPVSNEFLFTLMSDSKDSVIATIAVPRAGSLVGRGTFKLNGKQQVYGMGTASSTGPGTFTLTMRPSKKVREALKKSTRVKVSVALTFTPQGGTARTKNGSETVALIGSKRIATKVEVTGTTSFEIDPPAGFAQYHGSVSFTRVEAVLPVDGRVPDGLAKRARKECMDLFVTGTGVFRHVMILQSRPNDPAGPLRLSPERNTKVDGNGRWIQAGFAAPSGSTVIAKGGFWDRNYTDPLPRQPKGFKYGGRDVLAYCGAFGALLQYP